MNIVRKFQLVIINEDEKKRKEQYKFIRDSQYAQYRGLNRAMGYLMSAYYNNNMNFKSENFIEAQDKLTNSLYIFDDIEFGSGIDSKSAITRKVKKDFSTALKNGLAKGERGATNYKRSYPLMSRGRLIKLYEEDGVYYIKWVNKIIFKIILSHKNNKNYIELQHTLRKVLNNEYKISESSLYFNKENKLMMNLGLKIPDIQKEENTKGRIVGVDLGIKIPAYCSLNDKPYVRQAIGDIEDMLRVRQQFTERRRRLIKKMALIKGGRRRYKSAELNKLSDKEKNYARTYNHMVSKRIIEFAKKNKAEQINLELLSIDKGEENGAIIRYWGYYQLQTMIEYKAKIEGIKVAYVDPYHTSQICSCCGHFEEGQRTKQDKFICKNPGCKNFDKEINADWNASVNIAKSTSYIKDKEDSEYYKKYIQEENA